VAQWQAEGEDWLDELAALNQRMPATDRVYLKSLAVKPKLGTTESNIALEGLARERKDALTLNDTFLATGDRFRGVPVVEQAAPKEVEFYKWSFNKDIRLTDQSAKKPRPRGPARPSPADSSPPPPKDPSSAAVPVAPGGKVSS
jgi:hypothetical protein